MNKGKILIVDDQDIVRDTIVDILNREGYDTNSANSGDKALEILRKEKFDVLLTDIKMPGMNGLDLVEKAHTQFPEMLSILLTAYPSVDSIDQAIIKLGAFDYLLKPVLRDKLCEVVTSAMEKKKHYSKE